MPEEIVKLKVSEAKEDYVGKNIVTLDISIKQKLNLISGDVIEITGEKTTVAQVWPEKISERQENIIRMDQYIRNNADVSIGEFVTIKRVEPEIAHEIVLTPLREVNLISENLDVIIKKNFLGRPFLERNNVIINLFGNGVFFNINFSIKSSWSSKSRVNIILSVGCSNNNYFPSVTYSIH